MQMQATYRSLETWKVMEEFLRPGKSWNLIVGLGKSFNVLGKDHGKSCNLKASEEYEPLTKFCTVKRRDLEGTRCSL